MGVKCSIATRGILLILLAMLFTGTIHAASQEQVLHSFGITPGDGYAAVGPVVFDAAGNLYGTTANGGTSGSGTVFELIPNGNGTWTEEVLYSFGSQSGDGANPSGGLVFDSAGNLYGTTLDGGGAHCVSDCGRVFELTPNGNGTWTETTLYIFGGTPDGSYPSGGLIFDAAGNLYGTTYYGGPSSFGYGTVFELTPNGNGNWTETILHNFRGLKTDGRHPLAGLVRDAAGNLYGTTYSGGAYVDYGTVFEMKPKAGGGWNEGLLHSFNNNKIDGYFPRATLVLDAAGHLYGTTYEGGSSNAGTVFWLGRKPNGTWQEVVLHNFSGTDGSLPIAGLTFDAAGDLVGTTPEGGAYNWGTVFGMKHKTGGGWAEEVLHSFNNNGIDGASPACSLIFDAAGNLYGTTVAGDSVEGGIVFEITP